MPPRSHRVTPDQIRATSPSDQGAGRWLLVCPCISLRDSGDGWYDIEFVYFSNEKGKVILDTDDYLENIISKLEKL